jgi:hypothetical protein
MLWKADAPIYFRAVQVPKRSRNSAVSDTTNLRVGWPRVPNPVGQEIFLFSKNVQTGSGPHPASRSMSTGVSSPGSKAAGVRGLQHLPSVEVKNDWSYASTPPYSIMACIGTTFIFSPSLCHGGSFLHGIGSNIFSVKDCVCSCGYLMAYY